MLTCGASLGEKESQTFRYCPRYLGNFVYKIFDSPLKNWNYLKMNTQINSILIIRRTVRRNCHSQEQIMQNCQNTTWKQQTKVRMTPTYVLMRFFFMASHCMPHIRAGAVAIRNGYRKSGVEVLSRNV